MGEIISVYGDPLRRLTPTLERYRRHIRLGHVAVVGTEVPWAEAMLLNLGAGRVTTLEYRSLVIDHGRVVTVTPSQFARNFIDAQNNNRVVRYTLCHVILLDDIVFPGPMMISPTLNCCS